MLIFRQEHVEFRGGVDGDATALRGEFQKVSAHFAVLRNKMQMIAGKVHALQIFRAPVPHEGSMFVPSLIQCKKAVLAIMPVGKGAKAA